MSEVLTNDTRQEANTALMEVEKGSSNYSKTLECTCTIFACHMYVRNYTCHCSGLRSSRVGDQCEAVVKFPSLVDRFPFPILINAAYLKLAEVYRTRYPQVVLISVATWKMSSLVNSYNYTPSGVCFLSKLSGVN